MTDRTGVARRGLGRSGGPGLLPLAGALFFVSGAAALVLESLWIRLFALTFGTTGLAMSTVLAAFMAGLAIGGAVGGRVADRLGTPRRLLAAYAVMEAVIAAAALSMPWLRDLAARADVLFEAWSSGSMLGLSLGRFLVAVVVLVLPTTLMGATLPVLARAVTAAGSRGGVAVGAGSLYALNTIGAVAGAAATPFLLLPAFGLRGTGFAVAAVDLAVALAALLAARRLAPARAAPAEAPETGAPPLPAGERGSPAIARLALLGIGLSGLVAMVYQQVWARTLSLVIGSSIYAVSLILALFLLGLGVGSAVYSRRTAHLPGQASNLAVVHLVVALWSIATLRLADRLPAAFVLALPGEMPSPASVLGLQALLAAAVVVPPTFFMGMTFPATLRLVETSMPGLGPGRLTGSTYASNTVGAIFGAFVGGFVALPLLGTQGALVASAGASAVLAGLYGLLAGLTRGGRRAVLPLLAAAGVALLLGAAHRPWNLAALNSGVFRVSRSAELAVALRAEPGAAAGRAEEQDPDALQPWIEAARSALGPEDLWNDGLGPSEPPVMLSHRTGLTATVAVTESRSWSLLPGYDWVTYSLRVNGKADASLTVLAATSADTPLSISPQGDAETQVLSGALPALLHPGEPRSALVIGWGSGLTAGTALDTGLEAVRAVEIERAVVAGSEPFQPYAGFPLVDPRLELVEDDGRRLLSSRGDLYDIVVSEPSNPWITGCSNLFTEEFFRLVASRLAPRGLFLQWVQAYEISPETFLSILSALDRAFGAVRVFRPAHSPSDLLLVAGASTELGAWPVVARRLAEPRLHRRLVPFGIEGPEDLAARLVAEPSEVARLVQGVRPNTDDNLLVELAAPLDLVRHAGTGGGVLLAGLGVVEPARQRLLAAPPPDAAARITEAVARTGRGQGPTPVVPPSLVAFAGPDLSPELRLLLGRQGNREALADLADALGPPTRGEGADRAMAMLGLAAAQTGEHRVAILLLTAHLRLAPDPAPEARQVLALLAMEAGLPSRAHGLAPVRGRAFAPVGAGTGEP